MKILHTSLILILSISAFAQNTPWFEIPTNTVKKLNTISFGSSSVGYIGGNDSLLLKTTDGGQSWVEVTMSGANFSEFNSAIVNLKFVNETTGFMVVGQTGGVYKTTDGGSTWSQLQISGNLCFPHGLFFWNEQNGYIGGSGCFQSELIDIYTDGVTEPAVINSTSFNPANKVVDIDFLDADFGLAASTSRFLRTTDGGMTWDTIPSGTTDVLTSIEIVNDTLAYAGYIDESAGFGLIETHDGGLTWTMETQMPIFGYPDFNDIKATAQGYLYTVSKTDFLAMIFEKNEFGWWYYSVSQPLYALDSYGANTIFAVGDSGLVVTNVNPVLSVFETAPDENPLSVYPNPAEDNLYFDLGDQNIGTPSKAMIWNLNGQLVLEESRVDFRVDVSALSAGSYILEVVQNGRKFSTPFLKK